MISQHQDMANLKNLRRCNVLELVVFVLLLVPIVVAGGHRHAHRHRHVEDGQGYVSAVGDPGMRRDRLRVAIESWNQCNEVGHEPPTGSPRAADCFDLRRNRGGYEVEHKVSEEDNRLGVPTPIPGGDAASFTNADLYAAQKELYLASKCQVQDHPSPWHFWTLMLKNGNLDTLSGACPLNGHRAPPFGPGDPRFDCFGDGCMRHPTIRHRYTALHGGTLDGGFYGSWEDERRSNVSASYDVTWRKEVGRGSWVFHHRLATSDRFPWLMLYLRSDATHGFSGGYHYETRGMSKIIPESPNFNVSFTLNIIKGGGPKAQFYLMDMGSCWKNDGRPCDGDVTSDVTRYSEMILNPNTSAWCSPAALSSCPPFHTFRNGTAVHRSDAARFPYAAYHVYCSPGNAAHLESPYNLCDPYSNPQAQEIVQILPHPVWGEYGYPTRKGEGWVGEGPRTWELDVGGLSQNLYFYQDPGTKRARRLWSSIDLGVEIYRDPNQEAEWTLSDFDIRVPGKIITN